MRAVLILLLMMGGATDTIRAQDGDADIVVVIRVLPSSPVMTIDGAVSTILPDPVQSDPGASTLWMVLTVNDGRGQASGWDAYLQQAPSTRPGDRLVFIDRQCVANEEVDQSSGGGEGTCATMTAVDLPLDEPVSVFSAVSGFGSGTSRMRFRFGAGDEDPDSPIVLILAFPTAP